MGQSNHEYCIGLLGGECLVRVTVGGRGSSVITDIRNIESAARGNSCNVEMDAAIAAIERMILRHAQAGIDVSSPEYVEGLENSVQEIAAIY